MPEALPRRLPPSWLAGFVLVAAAGGTANPAPAQSCDGMSGARVRWIVPHAAGGGHDAYARLIVPFWERQLDVEVTVENHPGAGGLVGVSMIRDARPDGLTLGLVSGSGLIVARLVGTDQTPDLLEDLSILGEVAPVRNVWLSGTDEIRSLDDLLRISRSRPILFSLRDVGSPSLLDSLVVSDVFGIDAEIVAGYGGTASRLLALQRGEVDVMTVSIEAALPALESGRVRAILQIDRQPIEGYEVLRDVPWVGGESGVVDAVVAGRGGDVEAARSQVDALLAVMGAGRLIVAPRALPPALEACLERALAEVLADPELVRQAERAQLSWQPRTATQMAAELEALAEVTARFRPLVEAGVGEMRR